MLIILLLTAGAVLGWLYCVCRLTSRISETNDEYSTLVPSGFVFVLLAPLVWVWLAWMGYPYSHNWLMPDWHALWTEHRRVLVLLGIGLVVLAAESGRRLVRRLRRVRMIAGRVSPVTEQVRNHADLFRTLPGITGWLYQCAGYIPGNCISDVHIRHFALNIPRLPDGLNGLRILHITDLHYNGIRNHAYCKRLVEYARELKPDLVALTGDFHDSSDYISGLKKVIAGIEAHYGVYFVCGNHEYWDKPDLCIKALSDCGFKHLHGSILPVQIGDAILWLAGTDYPWGDQSLKPKLRQLPDEAVCIALSHDPDNADWLARLGVKLILSGHTHGGQIALPLFGPLVVPSRKGSARAAGFIPCGESLLYVSRGAGLHIPLRLGCPLEMTVFELRASGN